MKIIHFFICGILLGCTSCQKDDNSVTPTQGLITQNYKNYWDADILSDYQDSGLALIPNINLTDGNIKLFGSFSLANFRQELQSGKWDSWLNKSWLNKKNGPDFTPENFKYFFFGKMADAAENFQSTTHFTNFFNDGKKPEQTKLAYRFGRKKDYLNRIKPENSAGFEVFDPIFGLDCSGLVHNILISAGVVGYPIMCSEDQSNNLKTLEKAIIRAYPFMNGYLTVEEIKNPTVDDIDFGDIVYFKNKHIGIALKDYTNRKIIVQSNGKPANLKLSAEENLNKGPSFKDITEILNWPSINSTNKLFSGFKLIRIKVKNGCNAKTESGGNGVTENIHVLGSKAGQVTVNYEMFTIPDMIEIYYRDVKITGTSGAVSGNGQLTFIYNPSGNVDYIKVKVTGTDPSTAWEYYVNCPN